MTIDHNTRQNTRATIFNIKQNSMMTILLHINIKWQHVQEMMIIIDRNTGGITRSNTNNEHLS